MNTATNTPDFLDSIFQNTAIDEFWRHSSVVVHVLVILLLAFGVHFVVKIVHLVSEWFIRKSGARRTPLDFVTGTPKFVTLTHLIVSAVTFMIYFVAVGLVLVAVFHFSEFETAFRPQIVNAMKSLDPNYADWMVPVTYRASLNEHRKPSPEAPPQGPRLSQAGAAIDPDGSYADAVNSLRRLNKS